MKKYLYVTLSALLLIVPSHAEAKAVSAKSVNTFQTWSFGSVKWHQLLWDSNRNKLSAVITFTNDPYVMQGERRLRETGIFYFSGASRDKNGVVRIKGVPIGKAKGKGDGDKRTLIRCLHQVS